MSPNPYLSPAELAALIPYSEQALRVMRTRGEHREGEHYFRRGRRVIYKWAAIEAWIEGRREAEVPADVVPLYASGGVR